MSGASGLLPERIEALLAPDGLHLCRNGDGARHAVAAEVDGEAWRTPLAALDQALRRHPARLAPGAARLPAALAAALAPRLHVVLSENYVRWQMLPWQNEVATPAEKEAYARHAFREVYGDISRHWEVRCAEQAPGIATPACAIDDELPLALQRLAKEHGCRLHSLRPLLVAATARWRRKLPSGIVWFALLEAHRLSLGLLRDRRWQALRSEPLPDPAQRGELLAGMLARGALAAGVVPGTGRLLLCGEGAESCPAPLPADTVLRLGGALRRNAAERQSA